MSKETQDVRLEKQLHEYCRNATNEEDDRFVGIKSEINDGINELSVIFPLGFELPKNEEDARKDILTLVETLQKYREKSSRISQIQAPQVVKTIKFPINAYLTIIYDYFNRNGYYKETEEVYIRSNSGRVNYTRTIKKENAIALKQGFVYLNSQVRQRNDTDKELITKINQYCVYESFLKIGWLYNKVLPPKPNIKNQNQMFQTIIQKKINTTYKDNDRILFQSMLDILNYRDISDNPETFYFGTNNFEYIWEKIIEDVFGIQEKEKYFPRTFWKLNSNRAHKNKALEPDTIMLYDGDVYVLDAKYYKFGVTAIPSHLPNSSSINKQITYGEYIASADKFKEDIEKGMKIYNAFLMPYDKHNGNIVSNGKDYIGIGEAGAEWKKSEKDYERVQGVLVDVRTIMAIRYKKSKTEIKKLSEEILEQLKR